MALDIFKLIGLLIVRQSHQATNHIFDPKLEQKAPMIGSFNKTLDR